MSTFLRDYGYPPAEQTWAEKAARVCRDRGYNFEICNRKTPGLIELEATVRIKDPLTSAQRRDLFSALTHCVPFPVNLEIEAPRVVKPVHKENRMARVALGLG